MTKTRWDGLTFVILGALMLVFLCYAVSHKNTRWMEDFHTEYQATRCLLAHCDPYPLNHKYVYLPTAYILTLPFALLPAVPAYVLWAAFTALGLMLAGVLVWTIAADHAPALSGGLIGLLLANSAIVAANGNPAGVTVGLCSIAVWCFLQNRLIWPGILCLAFSLALKPQDAGLVWLFFLLAGGSYRKRALQSLAITAVLGVAAALWVSSVVPHWPSEMASNIREISASTRGSFNDPGPTGGANGTIQVIIDLPAAISVLKDNPRIYNPASNLVCGILLLVWIIATVKSRHSQALAWFALSAVVPLTLLATYHRPYDSKLLLLAVPACAMLWTEGGPIAWGALIVNSLALIFTAEIPILTADFLIRNLHIDTTPLAGRILAMILTRPASLSLLVMAIFNLWVYVGHAFGEPGGKPGQDTA